MGELLKFTLGWLILLVLQEKTLSCACLDKSELKAIFN